jgi:putative nucleotidyltransferase with HDIG domain
MTLEDVPPAGDVSLPDAVPRSNPEPVEVSLRRKVALSTAAVASSASLMALTLVGNLVVTMNDPELARQIGWHLLIIALAAGALSSLVAWVVVRRVTRSLRQLAETMSRMARSGELQKDFPSAGGGSEVQLIEETFRSLVVSLEESRQARERSYVEAVGAVVTAADARDHETAGHSFRVALYAVALAKAMGIRGDELKALEWGALLHDVGKMVVPDEILRKSGPLTEEEWLIMKQHPGWGYEMLAEVRFLQPAAIDVVYSHHERWDGQGYPRGLAGEQIPLVARIFAVVDAYDALTSDRPYRRACSHQNALNELRRVAGQQLDPGATEIFCELSEVELRRLRNLCHRVQPGLSLPFDLLETLRNPDRLRTAELFTAGAPPRKA